MFLLSAIISQAQTQKIKIDPADLKFSKGAVVETSEFRGKRATKVQAINKDETEVSVIRNLSFTDGTISCFVAAELTPDANPDSRGFIGIAFRLNESDSVRYECVYLRPDNGRANDQLRRNHATQYISEPAYPWYKLRKEFPGKYESYADMALGEWIQMRIKVKGNVMHLFVNDAKEPCLIVNDLKLKDKQGSIALWSGPGTRGYFRDLTVTRE